MNLAMTIINDDSSPSGWNLKKVRRWDIQQPEKGIGALCE
jgi:hypothetical protein